MRNNSAEPDWAELDLPTPKPPMPFAGEWMTPWIAAAFLVAVLSVTYVVGGHQLPMLEQALLAIGLCATLTGAVLVAIRSSRAREAFVREERNRPPAEALDGATVRPGGAAYAQAMERWATAMLELLEHASGCADEGSEVAGALQAALTDTRELRALLAATTVDDLDINTAAAIHSVCTLWETNRGPMEQLAASLDRSWHRRWSARVVADRRLRHGGAVPAPLSIPYRS
jgi:hypothetical protein